MSFDETILLKIKREFTQNEAVQILLKELAATKFRVGELESENAELNFRLIGKSEGRPSKLWKKDEYFAELKGVLDRTQKKKREASKELEKWRNRYFALLLKVNNGQNPEVSDTTGDAQSGEAG